MNKNIMKLVLPAIIAGIGLTNTGCVATHCYEAYPVTRLETTYVTTPVIETVYVEHPVHRTIHTPPPPPRKPAPRPQAKPIAKAKPVLRAKLMAKAKPAHKAKPVQPRQQAKAAPRQMPTTKPRKRG